MVRPRLVHQNEGPLRVFEMPEDDEDYVVGIDTAEGKLKSRAAGYQEQANKKDPDWNAMCVIRVSDGLEVASYLSHYAPDIFAQDAYLLGSFFNTAFMVPEINGPGFATVEHLRVMEYPRIYISRTWLRLENRFEERHGFRTSFENKHILVSRLQKAVRERTCGVQDERTAIHMAAMRFNARGIPEAPAGAHDDLAMALMLAMEGRELLTRGHEEDEDDKPKMTRDQRIALQDMQNIIGKHQKEQVGITWGEQTFG